MAEASCQKLNVEMQYVSPDRHEQNGKAERACGIVEKPIKALLMQNTLDPAWRAKDANGAQLLLNRFPTVSSDTSIPE